MSRIAPSLGRLLLRSPPTPSLPTTTTTWRRSASSFRPQPGPPKLPAEQQAEFERLQRAAAVSQAFQPPPPPAETPATETSSSSEPAAKAQANTSSDADENEVNQGLFRGAKPEFEGDTNPKTGEVGGPKNEPLRWGGDGDWSYNGRVTDF